MTDDMQRAVELANEIIDRWGTSAPWARDGRTLATALLASRAEVERMRAIVRATTVYINALEIGDETHINESHVAMERVVAEHAAIDRAKAGE